MGWLEPVLHKGLREVAQGRGKRVSRAVLETLFEDGLISEAADGSHVMTDKGADALRDHEMGL